MRPLPFKKLLCFNPLPSAQFFRDWNDILCPRQQLEGERPATFHAFGWLKWLMGSRAPVLLAAARNWNINQIFCPEPAWRAGQEAEEGRVCVETEHHLVEASPWVRQCRHNSKHLSNLLSLMSVKSLHVINKLLLSRMPNQHRSGPNTMQSVSFSVFIAESGAQCGHCYEEGCNHQWCVRIHEAAAAVAGWMGKIHPGVLWAPTRRSGEMQMPLPCKPTAFHRNF